MGSSFLVELSWASFMVWEEANPKLFLGKWVGGWVEEEEEKEEEEGGVPAVGFLLQGRGGERRRPFSCNHFAVYVSHHPLRLGLGQGLGKGFHLLLLDPHYCLPGFFLLVKEAGTGIKITTCSDPTAIHACGSGWVGGWVAGWVGGERDEG